jgi:hypothetical protein
MSATYKEIFIDQGSFFNDEIKLVDQYNLPLDLSDFTVKSEIRKTYNSTNVTAELVINIYNPTNGIIDLSLNSNVTSNIASGKYVYDTIIVSNTTNQVFRVQEGIAVVSPAVTKV